MKETPVIDMAPIQKLLQKLIVSAVRTCIIFRKTGHVPNVPQHQARMEYNRNLNFLIEVDEGFISFAGFSNITKVMKGIELVREGKVDVMLLDLNEEEEEVYV